MRLTNSVLDGASILLNTSDTAAPGSEAHLGFNTIVMESAGQQISCANTAFLSALFENNIIVTNGASAAVAGTGCTLSNNVLLPQPNAPASNIVLDPQFVDVVARNFRLRPMSPALGAASTTPTIFTDHDFEGSSRPQGSVTDIGRGTSHQDA